MRLKQERNRYETGWIIKKRHRIINKNRKQTYQNKWNRPKKERNKNETVMKQVRKEKKQE